PSHPSEGRPHARGPRGSRCRRPLGGGGPRRGRATRRGTGRSARSMRRGHRGGWTRRRRPRERTRRTAGHGPAARLAPARRTRARHRPRRRPARLVARLLVGARRRPPRGGAHRGRAPVDQSPRRRGGESGHMTALTVAILMAAVALLTGPLRSRATIRRPRRGEAAGHDRAEIDPAVVLDLLAVAIASGASIVQAVDVVGHAVAGRQGTQLRTAARALRHGAPWDRAWGLHPLGGTLEPAWHDGVDPTALLRQAPR